MRNGRQNAAMLLLLRWTFNKLCTVSCRSPVTCLFLIDKLCKVTYAECSHFHFHLNECNSAFILLKDVRRHCLQPEEGFNDSCLICSTNVFSQSFMLCLLVSLSGKSVLVTKDTTCRLSDNTARVSFVHWDPHTATFFFTYVI